MKLAVAKAGNLIKSIISQHSEAGLTPVAFIQPWDPCTAMRVIDFGCKGDLCVSYFGNRASKEASPISFYFILI